MPTPQQPELARNKRSPVAEESAKTGAAGPPPSSSEFTHIPEDNRPGHHPPVEQDKPTSPPKLPVRHRRFGFRREEPLALASRLTGVTDANSYVDVDDEQIVIRFGPWHIATPMSNVASAERTGPYAWWKVIGPPRLSIRDRGITFATATSQGVCIRFREPVAGALPTGLLRHPAATVTVDASDDLVLFIEHTPRPSDS